MRLSAFQVLRELFARSHRFRTLLLADFQEFLELAVGTEHRQPLPPPAEVAQKLRKAALHCVQDWHDKYGEAYKKLALGYHYLRQNKKVTRRLRLWVCLGGELLGVSRERINELGRKPSGSQVLSVGGIPNYPVFIRLVVIYPHMKQKLSSTSLQIKASKCLPLRMKCFLKAFQKMRCYLEKCNVFELLQVA